MHAHKRVGRLILQLGTVLLPACALDACEDAKPKATTAATTRAPFVDRWRGTWTGPEGTSLVISGDSGAYEITIRNLDAPRTFRGHASGNRITFVRDGLAEALRATDGASTGMKWLREKTDCLTVRMGEGYCR